MCFSVTSPRPSLCMMSDLRLLRMKSIRPRPQQGTPLLRIANNQLHACIGSRTIDIVKCGRKTIASRQVRALSASWPCPEVRLKVSRRVVPACRITVRPCLCEKNCVVWLTVQHQIQNPETPRSRYVSRKTTQSDSSSTSSYNVLTAAARPLNTEVCRELKGG